jgi:hypothetical protein
MDRAIASFVERGYDVVTKVGNGTLYKLRLSGQVAGTGGPP